MEAVQCVRIFFKHLTVEFLDVAVVMYRAPQRKGKKEEDQVVHYILLSKFADFPRRAE